MSRTTLVLSLAVPWLAACAAATDEVATDEVATATQDTPDRMHALERL